MWSKYWSLSFSISPSSEYSGLISFRIDWFDLRAVQGTLKSLLQHHRSKALILWCSAFFTVQLSHPYMTTGKTIALTRWTFVGKGMSLLFNMLSCLSYLFFQGATVFQFHDCSHSQFQEQLPQDVNLATLFSGRICILFYSCPLVAQMVNHLSTMRETQVQSLGGEDLLEKGMATPSPYILAQRIPWIGKPGRLWSMGSQRVKHN